MKDKVCVITGGTSGIGRATALSLARQGTKVVLLGRNSSAGTAVVKAICRMHGANAAEFFRVDLSDQNQIRTAVAAIKQQHPAIDVLINNAGARNDRYTTGSDGHELTFAVNHLGHFLLTCLLLERLLAAPAARIITVSSGNHGSVPSDGAWELSRDHYDRRAAYARSKMANIVFASALADRLRTTRATSNVFEPGGVASNFARNNGLLSWARHLLSHLIQRDLISPRTAAKSIIRLSSDPHLSGVTGRYVRRKNDICALTSYHRPEDASALWTLSLNLAGVDPNIGPTAWQIARH